MAGVIISNVITIGLALMFKWDLNFVMLGFWFQSVIIGFFNALRMKNLPHFSTQGLKMNNRPVPETAKGKGCAALFFAMHYGLFHLVYGGFIFALIAESKTTHVSFRDLVLLVAPFGVTHFIDYRRNLNLDQYRKVNIGKLMFFPYARIVPMHITIIIGSMIGSGALVLVMFLVLKGIADAVMERVEQNINNSAEPLYSGGAEPGMEPAGDSGIND